MHRSSLQLVLALGAMSSCAVWNPTIVAHRLDAAGWFETDAALHWRRAAFHSGCQALREQVAGREVVVMMHGVKGDGDEVASVVPVLGRGSKALFLFRWVPWAERDALSGELAAGLSRLLECLPDADGHLLVLAHSAGGVVSAYAANRVVIPLRPRTGPALYLLTVASPLAGTNDRAGNAAGRPEARFMLDLGSRITEYPLAPAAMAVAHLRTQYPGDQVMKPVGEHAPNDPAVGVPGARQTNLPPELTHDGAFVNSPSGSPTGAGVNGSTLADRRGRRGTAS